MYSSLLTSDINAITAIIQQLALVAAVCLVSYILLKKKDIVPKRFQSILVIILGIWTLATIGQTVVITQNYISHIRPLQKQTDLQEQGLN